MKQARDAHYTALIVDLVDMLFELRSIPVDEIRVGGKIELMRSPQSTEAPVAFMGQNRYAVLI